MHMQTMRKAFSQLEKITRTINNLKDLRAKGEVEDSQFNKQAQKYQALYEQSKQNLMQIRTTLKAERDKHKSAITRLNDELQSLGELTRAGQVGPSESARMREISRESDSRRKILSRIEACLQFRSSADAGGYVDVDIQAMISPEAVLDEINAVVENQSVDEAAESYEEVFETIGLASSPDSTYAPTEALTEIQQPKKVREKAGLGAFLAFDVMVAPKLVQVLFLLILFGNVLAVDSGGLMALAAFAGGTEAAAIVMPFLFAYTVGGLLILLGIRILLEVVIVLFKIHEDIHALRELQIDA
ncbi:MAG: hypothetical protein AMXMBFR84_16810 [Candidatus Hydrogenedentota bacterium]